MYEKRKHIDGKTITKTINLLRKLNFVLPRSYLLIIYKSFVRPHRDYEDTVHDQPNNSSLPDIIASLQYNVGEKNVPLRIFID